MKGFTIFNEMKNVKSTLALSKLRASASPFKSIFIYFFNYKVVPSISFFLFHIKKYLCYTILIESSIWGYSI